MSVIVVQEITSVVTFAVLLSCSNHQVQPLFHFDLIQINHLNDSMNFKHFCHSMTLISQNGCIPKIQYYFFFEDTQLHGIQCSGTKMIWFSFKYLMITTKNRHENRQFSSIFNVLFDDCVIHVFYIIPSTFPVHNSIGSSKAIENVILTSNSSSRAQHIHKNIL